MKKDKLRLISKEDLYFAGRLWRLRFEAPEMDYVPGKFVNIAIDGKYLRRPVSVSEYSDGVMSLVVQIVGDGTKRLVETPVGRHLEMLTGLGNGFSIPGHTGKGVALLIGGGVGYAPLVGLMKKLRSETDLYPFAVFGFNGEADVPFNHILELREEGYSVEYCTMTGEMGERGNALEVALEHIDNFSMNPTVFYTCGPLPMMKAVCGEFDFDGQVSLEARMGCGFGACMGCSVMTADGPRRICKEGPVFNKSELLW